MVQIPHRNRHPAEQYARDIIDGRIVACKPIIRACERYFYDKLTGKSRGIYFDEDAAQRVINFIERLCHHSKGEWGGQKLILEPWQKFFIWNIFGWKEISTGYRRFKTVYLQIARKNGKSTLASAIGLFLLIADEEPGAEIYCLDPQTKILKANLKWETIDNIQIGDELIGIDEHPKDNGQYRKLRRSKVLNKGEKYRSAIKITFENGESVICGLNHPFLGRSFREYKWIKAKDIKKGYHLNYFFKPWDTDKSRGAGYLAGFFDGEGYLSLSKKKRRAIRLGYNQNGGRVLRYVHNLLKSKGFEFTKLRSMASSHSNTFESNICGFSKCIEFLGKIRPKRLIENSVELWEGKSPHRSNIMLKVVKIEKLKKQRLIDIETETKTFIANGFISHNSAAVKREQALITHSEATRMVKKSPYLKSQIGVFRHNLHIEKTASKFEPLGRDSDSCDGLNIHGAIVDELHAHKTREMWDVLETATGSRRQPLQIAITTAGFDRDSICYEQYEYLLRILKEFDKPNGFFDDSYFGLIYTLDMPEKEGETGDDYKNESVWLKANPNLEISQKLDDLRRKIKKVSGVPSAVNNFLRKHMDVWVQQSTRWIDMDLWDSNFKHNIIEEDLHGRPFHGGVDLSSVSDITAWVMAFPDPSDPEKEQIDVIARFWCPESRLTSKTNRYRAYYEAWHRDGWLKVTPGDAIDYEDVKKQILLDAKHFNLIDMGVDRLFQGYQLSMELSKELGTRYVAGKQEEKVAAVGMGYRTMTPAMKELESRLLKRKINHGNNPVMRWMADNLAVSEDPAGGKKPNKATSQGKIDGIIGLLIAIDRMNRKPLNAGGSKYERQDMASV